MEVSGVVQNFFEGKFNVPGIKLSGSSQWWNAPERSGILTKDLEGQMVTLKIEDVYGDGLPFITRLTTANGMIRTLNPNANFAGQGIKPKAKVMVGEFLVFYELLKQERIPKHIDAKDSYAIRELEAIVSKEAIELWKVYHLDKTKFLEQVKRV